MPAPTRGGEELEIRRRVEPNRSASRSSPPGGSTSRARRRPGSVDGCTAGRARWRPRSAAVPSSVIPTRVRIAEACVGRCARGEIARRHRSRPRRGAASTAPSSSGGEQRSAASAEARARDPVRRILARSGRAKRLGSAPGEDGLLEVRDARRDGRAARPRAAGTRSPRSARGRRSDGQRDRDAPGGRSAGCGAGAAPRAHQRARAGCGGSRRPRADRGSSSRVVAAPDDDRRDHEAGARRVVVEEAEHASRVERRGRPPRASSRSAASTAVSPPSTRPPGSAHWPAWLLSFAARRVSTKQGRRSSSATSVSATAARGDRRAARRCARTRASRSRASARIAAPNPPGSRSIAARITRTRSVTLRGHVRSRCAPHPAARARRRDRAARLGRRRAARLHASRERLLRRHVRARRRRARAALPRDRHGRARARRLVEARRSGRLPVAALRRGLSRGRAASSRPSTAERVAVGLGHSFGGTSALGAAARAPELFESSRARRSGRSRRRPTSRRTTPARASACTRWSNARASAVRPGRAAPRRARTSPSARSSSAGCPKRSTSTSSTACARPRTARSSSSARAKSRPPCSPTVAAFDVADLARRARVPAIVLWARRGDFPLAIYQRVFGAMARARIVEVDAGHLIPMEQPQLVADAVLAATSVAPA